MIRRNRLCTLILAALALACGGKVLAQEKRLNLDLAENDRFLALRDGKKPGGDAEKAKNEEVLRKMAQIQVNRLLDAANNTSAGSNTGLAETVKRLGDVIIDPLNPPRKLKTDQIDVINVFGKELATQLMKLLGTPEKPSGADIIIKVNAARMMSILGRSGYEGVGDHAVMVLTDPKQHHAVKFYMLEALRHLFAVPHPERDGKSVFSKPEAENRAIQVLIDFIARKPDLGADAPRDEVDAYRYIRREAVRALGQVRMSVVRVDDKVVAVPALWLLRMANADKNIVPPASLAERVEGLVGYLQLSPDKDLNMDFAVGFVAEALRDITRDFKGRHRTEKPKADEKKPPDRTPEPSDYFPWRLTANRLDLALTGWRNAWEASLPASAKPPEVQNMLKTLVSTVTSEVLKPIIENQPSENIVLGGLDGFLSTNKFPNVTLLTDDKNSFISRPGS
jgi:hypothetical protein